MAASQCRRRGSPHYEPFSGRSLLRPWGRARAPGPAAWRRPPCRRAPGAGPAGRRHGGPGARCRRTPPTGMGSQKFTRRQPNTARVATFLVTPNETSRVAADASMTPRPPGGDGNGAQHVGDAVGGEQLDRVDEMPEGGDERPQRGGVEEPVESRPTAAPVLRTVRSWARCTTESPTWRTSRSRRSAPTRGMRRPTDRTDAHGPLPAGGEGVRQHCRPEQGEQAHQRGDDVDGMEAGQGDRHQQRHPQHDVEHDGRPDGLGRHGEAGVGALDALGGEQAVTDPGSSGRSSRDDMGDGRGGEDDPDDREEPGPAVGQERAGQLGVAHDGARLEGDPRHEPPDVELAEEMEVLARPHQLGDHQVFDDEQNQEHEEPVAQPPGDDSPPRAP